MGILWGLAAQSKWSIDDPLTRRRDPVMPRVYGDEGERVQTQNGVNFVGETPGPKKSSFGKSEHLEFCCLLKSCRILLFWFEQTPKKQIFRKVT